MHEARRVDSRRSSVEDAMPSSPVLLEAHIPGLRRFARALLRGDEDRADDLLQDSLERALSRWHQRRRDGNLRSWVYTILYNRFLTDTQRRLRRQWISSLTAIGEQDLPRVKGGQDGVLAYRDLLRAFAELREDQRAVLLLIGVEDFTYAEAADILGVPLGTVMSRLSRGRERLRQYMNGDRARTQSLRPPVKKWRHPSPAIVALLTATSNGELV
jgi:RNA polymerase sigma-70 factor, ECF subfamily